MKKLYLTKEILTRRIKCNIANIITGFDDIEYINSFIQENLIYYNKIINNIYSIYKSLNVEDALNIINKLDLTNYVSIVMNNKKSTN
jgi:hypothetical protein